MGREKIIYSTGYARGGVEKRNILNEFLGWIALCFHQQPHEIRKIEKQELPHALADHGAGRFQLVKNERGEYVPKYRPKGSRNQRDINRIVKAAGKHSSAGDQAILNNNNHRRKPRWRP
jgi:hypothetical protein